MRTESLASIWLTVAKRPTSRRNSSRFERLGPVGVVDERRLGRAGLEVEQLGELHLDPLDVVAERVVVEQVALVAAPGRIADHPRRAAGERERTMSGELEAAHEQLADEVPDVQRVGGRVEADVEADRTTREARRERGTVGRVVDEATSRRVRRAGP